MANTPGKAAEDSQLLWVLVPKQEILTLLQFPGFGLVQLQLLWPFESGPVGESALCLSLP